MAEVEWAILQKGEIVNVVTTSAGRAAAQQVANSMTDGGTVVPLDSLPISVKQRYRYWNERP